MSSQHNAFSRILLFRIQPVHEMIIDSGVECCMLLVFGENEGIAKAERILRVEDQSSLLVDSTTRSQES